MALWRRLSDGIVRLFRGFKALVEQIVYFTLGFVICGLIGLAFLPMVSGRARRLTLARIEARLPMTFDEIEAERDLLRARHAVEIRALEIKVEEERAAHTGDAAELGRRAVAVTRAREQLEQTTALLNERNAQLAKSLAFGEKTQGELNEAQEALAARQEELREKRRECDEFVLAHSEIYSRVNALEAALKAASNDLRDTKARLETTEAARRQITARAERLARDSKSLAAALAEAKRLLAESDASHERLLAKIATERQRGDEFERANHDLRSALAEGRTPEKASVLAIGSDGVAFPLTPEQEMMDLREAIAGIGRQVAQMDATQD